MFGMNWSLAERLPFPVYGRFWLVPANGFLCLLELRKGTVNQTCARTKDVLTHGLTLAFLGTQRERVVYGAHRFVIGVVPDRTRKVTIDTGETKVTVRAISNVFVQRDDLSNPPTRLILAVAGS